MAEQTASKAQPLPPAASPRTFATGVAIHWVLLFLFWVVLSGMLDAFHLSVGLVCSGLVALFMYELQLVERVGDGVEDHHLAATPWHRHVGYVLWLLVEIVQANLQVLRIVLDPKLPIDPSMVRYRTKLRSDLGKTALANSITLTPGTVTVLVARDELIVHALVADETVSETIARMEQGIRDTLPRESEVE